MHPSLPHSGPPTPGQEQTLGACLDLPLSYTLARQIRARPNHCFANAWRALIERPDLFENAWFIEGWFVIEMDGQVTMNEHGWVARPDGSIVDPSVLLIVPVGTPVFYFPGVARTWQETEALEGQILPHVCFDGRHGPDGLGHPDYHAAREAARRKVYALALAHTPCLPMRFWRAMDLDGKGRHSAETQSITRRLEQVSQPEEPVLDLTFSETVASTIGARAGRCWYNVRDALLQMPHPLLFARAVEGWLIEQQEDRIQLVEHGWLHWQDRLIDPTIVREEQGYTRLEYVPGISFSWGEMQQWAEYPLPLARFLVNAPGYQSACLKALERAEKRAWQTGLPLVPCPGFLLLSVEGKPAYTLHLWEFPVPAMLSPAVPMLLQAWWKGLGRL
jgi:hypothetical protein